MESSIGAGYLSKWSRFGLVRRRARAALVLAGVLVVAAHAVPTIAGDAGDDDTVWQAFVSWLRSAPDSTRLADYAEHLSSEGVSEDEAGRRLGVIRRLLSEQPERGIEVTYDRIFAKPLTGDPEQDGFTSTPSVFMVESVQDLQPGAALDVGAGQGRNAVWLAAQGWRVTAIDVSGVGLEVARRSAERAGSTIATVKTTYDSFDFGTEQWDLVLMILSWAPVSDPGFVARIDTSLRPGGVLVFEHVIDKPGEPFPDMVHALEPGQLRGFFDAFHIEYYDESERLGDWGGPPTPIVRMIARKPRRQLSE